MILKNKIPIALKYSLSIVVLRMKKIILLATLIGLFSCDSFTILDKKFEYKFYEKLDYAKLVKSELVSDEDLFLINYTIVRQRDYFNYTVEGKTYGEILELGKSLKENGMPVEVKMEDNGIQNELRQIVVREGVGHVRVPNSKKVIKTLNFKCEFENPTDKDIVLLSSSFIVEGPFGDYLSTVNFEVNCILQAGTKVFVPCAIPGKTIQQNILFEGNPLIQRLGIDNIINELQVKASGISYQDEGRYFRDCFFNAARIEPQNIINYKEDLKDKNWKISNSDGTYSLDFGKMHIPNERDEVIEMRR